MLSTDQDAIVSILMCVKEKRRPTGCVGADMNTWYLYHNIISPFRTPFHHSRCHSEHHSIIQKHHSTISNTIPPFQTAFYHFKHHSKQLSTILNTIPLSRTPFWPLFHYSKCLFPVPNTIPPFWRSFRAPSHRSEDHSKRHSEHRHTILNTTPPFQTPFYYYYVKPWFYPCVYCRKYFFAGFNMCELSCLCV